MIGSVLHVMLCQRSMLKLTGDRHRSEVNRFAMMIRDRCPQCGSTHYKKNGHIHNGKQSYCCRACGRQFVLLFDQLLVSDEQRALIGRLLRERLSLHGICRAVGVGMKWLLGFVVNCYEAAPEDLNVQLPQYRWEEDEQAVAVVGVGRADPPGPRLSCR